MKYLLLSFLVLFGLNLFLWNRIVFSGDNRFLTIHFLDVGQGDSQLIELPEGVQILSDAGPGKEVLFELDKVMDPTDRYIDMLIVSHPQKDHFGGFISVLSSYEVGLVIYSGIEGVSGDWEEFVKLIEEKNIPVVKLKKGAVIQHLNSSLTFLSPSREPFGGLNDNSLVFLLESEGSKTLFTGDISSEVEEKFMGEDVDILKVAHHGSRYSSGLSFLRAINPKVSIIGVGENRFGHPHESVLKRLKSINAEIYRTDLHGLISLFIRDGIVKIQTEKIEK